MANIGTHQTHCCARHGCKYADDGCPVVTSSVVQEYPCEFCSSTEHIRAEIAALQEELAWSEKLEERGLRIYDNDY